MRQFDPECFYTQIEWLSFPECRGEIGIEARIWAYATPFGDYQVTWNGREIVARVGVGEWGRKFGSTHEEIVSHYGRSAIERSGL